MVLEYRRHGYSVAPVIWSRGEPVSGDEGYAAVYTGVGGYGRRFGNLLVRIRWIAFIALYIWQHRRTIDVVHSVDLDVGIISVPMGKILSIPVVYDAFDQMASFFRPSIFTRILASFERWIIAGSTIAIFPDPIRLEQYGIALDDHVKMISNIPEAESADLYKKSAPTAKVTDKSDRAIHLVYVGTLEERHRALEIIPSICDRLKDKVVFSVAGVGFLADFFSIQSKARNNLNFAGTLPYEKALRLMSTADCLFGPYLLTTPAHRYAVPNKMYEHLALGKPLLTNEGTPVGDLVRRESSGFLFDGTEEGLFSAISKLTPENCRAVGKIAAHAWQETYSGMRSQQLHIYFSAIESVFERA